VLYGRDQECAEIDRLLARLRAGRCGTLVVLGEPGVGKSALLAHALSQADDLCVLRAVGWWSTT